MATRVQLGPTKRLAVVLSAVGWLLATPTAMAREILWFCNPGGSKQYSTSAALNSRIRFELGVFTGSFVPSAANISQWAANWQAAQRVSYNPATGVFSGSFSVGSNTAPFTVGKRAYIWGFNRDYENGEWILAGDAAWTWPLADPYNPFPLEWDIAAATEVIAGTVHASGSPFVLRTQSIAGSIPPATSWSQWRAEMLAGQSLDKPGDDPDHDGLTNLEEYALAGDPLDAASAPRPVRQDVTVGADHYLAVFLPKRPDRTLNLSFGTSQNLSDWNWSAAATVTVAQSSNGWTVRCAQPVTALIPRNFLRVRYSLP